MSALSDILKSSNTAARQTASSSSSTSSSSGASSASTMNMDDFVKIMVTELQQQDPFEPMDSKDLVAQIGQINSIQTNAQLNETLKKLANNQSLASASAMIGKEITGLTTSGRSVNGIVTSVKVAGDSINLELDTGDTLPIDNVTEVVNPSPTQTMAASVAGATASTNASNTPNTSSNSVLERWKSVVDRIKKIGH
jgi:flagellar basal-body rod modification protein FlgD